jgi:hypothetical protein
MLPHSLLFNYLWIAPALLQLILAALLIYKGWHKDFPWFFSHALFVGTTDLVLYYFLRASWIDNNSYLIADSTQIVCLAILRFGIIYEIYSNVSKRYPALESTGNSLFRIGTIVLVILGVGIALYAGPVPYGPGWSSGFDIVRSTVNIVQCGLLLLLLWFARYLKLSWRNYSFGVAVGMGINSSVRLLEAAIRTQMFRYLLPAETYQHIVVWLNFVTMSVYHVCVLVWVGYLFLPQPALQACERIRSSDLQSWDDELERLVQR